MSDIPDLPAQSIAAMVLDSAERYGEATALIDGQHRWTYTQLGRDVRRAVRATIGLGIEPGDRVGLWAPNTAEWILSALGILGAGAILVPLNTRWTGEEIAYALEKADASALFVAQGFLGGDQVGSVREAGPALRCLGTIVTLEGAVEGARTFPEFLALDAGVDDAEVDRRLAAIGPESTSDVMFTSGTTGRPKGVKLRHGTSMQLYCSMGEIMTLRPGDVDLVVPPFFHCFGYKAGWMASFMFGMTVVPQKVFDTEEVLARIEAETVSVYLGPPTIYSDLLNHPRRGDFDLSSLRVGCPSAASVPVELIKRIKSDLGFDIVLNAYGLTEAHAIVTACVPEDDPELVANTAGRPVAGVEVTVVGDDGTELPPGEQGEILVRGYNLMDGYYEDPEATAEAIDADGWLHTGDIGFLNEGGYLKITDRKKDMIITGGFNVYPAEIERVLLLDERVGEAAVVAAPDERMGEVAVAFVIPRPGQMVDPDALLAMAPEHLARYKVPREVRVVESLPRNASMKVLKHELRDELRREAATRA
jgi:acyl-CoA synthetase (AMP-forming)/AMP-acid ligase II